jgi:hypothetical protein
MNSCQNLMTQVQDLKAPSPDDEYAFWTALLVRTLIIHIF